MDTKTRKQKGKRLEKYVAKEFKKYFDYTYSRADSGSGKFQKEDVTLPDYVPLFIECKNHNVKSLKRWWKQTLDGCPPSKYPVLIYKLPYFEERVYMKMSDAIGFVSLSKQKIYMENVMIDMTFKDFLKLVGMFNERRLENE